jgi:hypothetical protein
MPKPKKSNDDIYLLLEKL